MSSDDLTLENLNMKDDDHAPVSKKSRSPKARLPPSLLWQIPTEVLKQKDGNKKVGTVRYNTLGCKVCNISFHKKEALSFHMEGYHRNSSAQLRSSPSVSRVSSRSTPQRVPARRRSNRMMNRSISYNDDDDDDIEVLDDFNTSTISERSGPSPRSSRTGPSPRSSRSGGKSRRDMVEVVDLGDSDDDDIQDITMDLAEEPRRSSRIKHVSSTQRTDEEILLYEDDQVGEGSNLKRRSNSPHIRSDALKKQRLEDNTITMEEMIEVKSKSGESLFLKKSTLSKVLPQPEFKSRVSPVERLLRLAGV